MGLSFFIMALLLFIVCILIVSVIADYRLFQKAGEEGWKSIIPIYSQFVFCKCFMGRAEYAAVPMVASFLSRAIGRSGDSAFAILCIPFSVVPIVFSVYQSIDLAKSFGKSKDFTWGLILLPFVFKLILAFSDDQYYGPKGSSMNSSFPSGFQNNYGYGNSSYIGDNGYQNNGYNMNNAYQNTGYQNGGYNNNTGYQNSGYNNNTGYQNSGYSNNTGYQNGGYSNNTGYQNSGYNNNTGYQNSGYNNAYNNNGTMDDIDISNINTDDLDNQ